MLAASCLLSSCTPYLADHQNTPPENAVINHPVVIKTTANEISPAALVPAQASNNTLLATSNDKESDPLLPPSSATYLHNLRQAASEGDNRAQAKLGDIYFAGKLLPPDMELAANWYKLAAQSGNTYAVYTLSLLYHEGWGVKQDTALASQWRHEADSSFTATEAQRQIAERFAKYDSRWYDIDSAIEWYSLAAHTGDAEAQIALGDIYRDGMDRKSDYFEALKWYGKAADVYPQKAAYNIALLFLNGQGVEKDPVVAAQWMERAARANSVPAQFALAQMYYLGQGIKKDNIMAYAWWKVATTQQPNTLITEKMASIGKMMKPAELTQALQLADTLHVGY